MAGEERLARRASTPAPPPAATGTAASSVRCRSTVARRRALSSRSRLSASVASTRAWSSVGLDRAGQVVDRAHLDAAHDAVQVVEPGHDDHRDRARGAGSAFIVASVANPSSSGITRSSRTRSIGASCRQQVERLPPVLRLGRLVAEPLEQPDERQPVHPAVVDDEDVAAARVRRRARSRGDQPRRPTPGRARTGAVTTASPGACRLERRGDPGELGRGLVDPRARVGRRRPRAPAPRASRAISASAVAPTLRLLPLSVCAWRPERREVARRERRVHRRQLVRRVREVRVDDARRRTRCRRRPSPAGP